MSTLLATIVETPERAFELARLPGGWMRLVLLCALGLMCYTVVWFYRRERRAGAGRGLRTFLAVLRCAVILVLAGIWLQPVIATYTVRTIGARVAVLMDRSASMSIDDSVMGAEPDAEAGTRLLRIGALLRRDDFAWLRRLAATNELAAYAFGERIERVRLPWSEPEAEAVTGGAGFEALFDGQPSFENHTDFGRAVTAAVEDAGESPIAGIVVLSDGGVNHGLAVDDVVAYARRFKAPVFTVGVGSPREPPNLRVVSLAAPATTPRGDPFEIRADLAATGTTSQQVEVELTVRRVEDNGSAAEQAPRVLERRRATLEADGQSSTLRFEIKPDAAGEYSYGVRAAPLDGEPVVADNEREVNVLVLEQSLRVLIVAGRPSYDYLYVSRLFERDKTINVSCWLQSADENAVRDGNTVIVELPRKPEEVFAYDAILLMDPDPRDLDASWAVSLRRLVDEFGGGLLLACGPHYTTRFLGDARMSDLVSLLPVTPDPDADVRLSEHGAYRTRSHAFGLPADAQGHPLLALHPDPDINRQVWAALPGVWWYLPVLREKPLASVLLRRADSEAATVRVSQPTRQPPRQNAALLLAVQPVGAGRTAFMAFESTWTWRSTAEPYFNRFWVQMVRYLAQARRQGASRRGTINLDRETLNVGDFAKLETRVLDESFVPWHAANIEAVVEFADGTRHPLRLDAIAGREGWFGGRILLDREGPAAIRVPLPASTTTTQPGETALVKRVRVQRPEAEMRALRLHEEELTRLAVRTGGRYVPLDQAGPLPDWIENTSEVRPPVRGDVVELWDVPWLLSVLALLLSVEWAVRRRNHLL